MDVITHADGHVGKDTCYVSMNIKEPYQQAQRAETPPQAIGIYEKIIQRDPQNSEAYNNIGELYVNMGQPTGGLIVNKKLTL